MYWSLSGDNLLTQPAPGRLPGRAGQLHNERHISPGRASGGHAMMGLETEIPVIPGTGDALMAQRLAGRHGGVLYRGGVATAITDTRRQLVLVRSRLS